MNTLLGLKHPHVIFTKEWFESKERYYLVFELAAGGELFEHLMESPNCRFAEDEAREVIYALAVRSFLFLRPLPVFSSR